MYNKKDIEKTLIEFNYFIDETTLDNFIKNWKIDPIYEDEDGIEFFDNLSIVKLKKGISLKSQGYDNEKIIYHINKIGDESALIKNEVKVPSAESKTEPVEENVEPVKEEPKELPIELQTQGEFKNLTIDISSQTLQMLADAVASKITSDIKTQLIEDGSLKSKNEELSNKVEELTEDNKKLAQRIEELEKIKKISFINFEYFSKFFKK